MSDPRPIKILSIAWGLAGGGVSHYIGLIDGLEKVDSVKLSHVVIRMPQWNVHQRLWKQLHPTELLIRNRLDLSWLPILLKTIKRTEVTHLFVHDFNAFFVGTLCRLFGVRIPILASYHNTYIPRDSGRRKFAGLIHRHSVFFSKHVATRVITVAEMYRQELIQQGVNPHKIVTVHNGVPHSAELKKEGCLASRKVGIPLGATIIGTTSRFTPEKGLDYLIKAMPEVIEQHPGAHLVLLGSGPLRGELESLSTTLGISNNLHFVGFHENIDEWLTGFHIFALPSLAEGHSIGLLEAMRASRAIVCTPVGDNTETIRDETDGLVVPVKDSKALATALTTLVADPALRTELGASARRRFELSFTASRMTDATLKVIASC